jgi:hypothetical protein
MGEEVLWDLRGLTTAGVSANYDNGVVHHCVDDLSPEFEDGEGRAAVDL